MAFTINYRVKVNRHMQQINVIDIVGDNIQELITESLARIRKKSKEFYKETIMQELSHSKMATVDNHAGMGFYIFVKLLNE